MTLDLGRCWRAADVVSPGQDEKSSLDGFDPSGGDWADCRGTEELNEVRTFTHLTDIVALHCNGRWWNDGIDGVGEGSASESGAKVLLTC